MEDQISGTGELFLKCKIRFPYKEYPIIASLEVETTKESVLICKEKEYLALPFKFY